jgi:hypothetical protein
MRVLASRRALGRALASSVCALALTSCGFRPALAGPASIGGFVVASSFSRASDVGGSDVAGALATGARLELAARGRLGTERNAPRLSLEIVRVLRSAEGALATADGPVGARGRGVRLAMRARATLERGGHTEALDERELSTLVAASDDAFATSAAEAGALEDLARRLGAALAIDALAAP